MRPLQDRAFAGALVVLLVFAPATPAAAQTAVERVRCEGEDPAFGRAMSRMLETLGSPSNLTCNTGATVATVERCEPDGDAEYCERNREIRLSRHGGQIWAAVVDAPETMSPAREIYRVTESAAERVCRAVDPNAPSAWARCDVFLEASCSFGGTPPPAVRALACEGASEEAPTVTQVSAGARHTCALMSDGTVYCWGYNSHGALGDGTTASRAQPRRVANLYNVTEVSAGGGHTCAVSGGRVWCWGFNEDGQLGDGTIADRLAPVQVLGAGYVESGVGQLSTGTQHTCAVFGETLRCWGFNEAGSLGDGTLENRSRPVDVQGLPQVYQVSAGQAHTCAIAGDERGVYCWGWNATGQLGDHTRITRPSPVAVGFSGTRLLSSGGDHTCAGRHGHELMCWGGEFRYSVEERVRGATRTRNRVANLTRAEPVRGMDDLAAVSARYSSRCARTRAGTIVCADENVRVTTSYSDCQRRPGQRCARTFSQSLSWTFTADNVEGLSGVTDFSNGLSHYSALDNAAVLRCWGSNDDGQLGREGPACDSQDAAVVPFP